MPTKILSILILIVTLASCQSKEEKHQKPVDEQSLEKVIPQEIRYLSEDELIGQWKFIYPSLSPELKEDHYMIFQKGAQGLTGTYFGTTDDFDQAREGYLPGFFKANINNIELKNDSISFELTLNEDRIYQEPVYSDATGKESLRLEKWDIGLVLTKRQYVGFFKDEKLQFDIEDHGLREFTKQK